VLQYELFTEFMRWCGNPLLCIIYHIYERIILSNALS